MSASANDKPDKTDSGERLHDWAVSLILVSIWLFAAFLVMTRMENIPISMLLIATVFFFMLLPAMREFAKNTEKYFNRKSQNESVLESNQTKHSGADRKYGE